MVRLVGPGIKFVRCETYITDFGSMYSAHV